MNEKVSYEAVLNALKVRGFRGFLDATHPDAASFFMLLSEQDAPFTADGKPQQLIVRVYKTIGIREPKAAYERVEMVIYVDEGTFSGSVNIYGVFWESFLDTSFYNRMLTRILRSWNAFVSDPRFGIDSGPDSDDDGSDGPVSGGPW